MQDRRWLLYSLLLIVYNNKNIGILSLNHFEDRFLFHASRRSRILLRRGPAFVWSAMSTRFSGGGVVAEFFRDLKKAYAIQWGGGVVAEIFRDLKNAMRFSLCDFGLKTNYAIFRDLKTSFYLNEALLHFFTFPKGGPGPPPESATACIFTLYLFH